MPQTVEAQEERERDGEAVGHVLLGAGLLALQGVDVVGRPAHDHGREAREQRHDERRTTALDGDEAQELRAGGAGVRDGVDDVHQTKEDDHLDGQGDEREKRMVVLLVIELVLLLLDGLAVTVVAALNAEQLGHELHHHDAVLLAPYRERHEDDLGEQGEEKDCRPPTTGEVVGRLHDKREEIR